MIHAHSTTDVSLALLRRFSSALESDLPISVDEQQAAYRSYEPPSWVWFLAEADWWIKALAAYSALYVAEITKELAKATWRTVATRLKAPKQEPLERLANELVMLREELAERTELEIGLAIPDNYFGTRLKLEGVDKAEIVVQIALFIEHVPALLTLVEKRTIRIRAATGIFLALQPNRDLEVAWIDKDSLERETTILPLQRDG